MCIPKKSKQADKFDVADANNSPGDPSPFRGGSKSDSSAKRHKDKARRERGEEGEKRDSKESKDSKEKEKGSKEKEKDKEADIPSDDAQPLVKAKKEKSDEGGEKPKKFHGGEVTMSFKVAKSSRQSKSVVDRWVKRALEMGVTKLLEEFKTLSKWKPDTMTTNAFNDNKDKNRYLDVPCQDQRRVVLKWPGLPSDYIHANYVATPNSDNRFICTQGPLVNTMHSFWAMTLQVQSECVIMLCNTVECGKNKCMQYWPNEKGETMTFGEEELGKITVTNTGVQKLCDAEPTIRVCKLKLDWKEGEDQKSHVVTHYQWENWPDRGVPPTRLTAVNLLSFVRGTTKPVIVHCSAGIGRTGTIVAISYVQEKMQNGQSCMEMDALLKELRTQRPYSIQNEFQYLYLHRVLLAYFLEKYRERFSNCLAGEGASKYKQWCEDYKKATGCD